MRGDRVTDAQDREALWRGLLTGEHSPIRHDRGRYKRWPGLPRCKMCLYPLGGPVARLLRIRSGRGPSRKNPNYCNVCEEFVRTHPGGIEIDLSMLFADVRGSTTIAEKMQPSDFTSLMNQFFRSSTKILIDSDALIDKYVGDEVIGLYLPVLVPAHPRVAIEAARRLLVDTGHRKPDGPWLPVGVGVHTGTAYVGSVGEGRVADFTAMGDAVNVTARLASAAKAGEILVSEDAWIRGGIEGPSPPTRKVEVKGRSGSIVVRVLGESQTGTGETLLSVRKD